MLCLNCGGRLRVYRMRTEQEAHSPQVVYRTRICIKCGQRATYREALIALTGKSSPEVVDRWMRTKRIGVYADRS